MLENNHKVDDTLVDLIFFECKDQLKKEIEYLKLRQSTIDNAITQFKDVGAKFAGKGFRITQPKKRKS